MSGQSAKTYIVEHLDDELGPWSELEYVTITNESHAIGASFCLSSIPTTLQLPAALINAPGFCSETRSVEDIYAASKDRVCLLDPAATVELSPSDGDQFDVFLFGGILGDDPPRVPMDEIPYIDYPEIRVNKNESTEMPFRYVKGRDNQPIMPAGMVDLIKKDSEKSFGDLF